MGWMHRLAPLSAVAALLLPWPAAADNNWKSSSAVWRVMDNCTAAARKQFPDYTRESNAKREKARQDCLRAYNLPSEGTSLQPPTPTPQQPAAHQ
ncbi:MAG: hypothetical protein ACLQJR_31700 [Stellaceae bacterium]